MIIQLSNSFCVEYIQNLRQTAILKIYKNRKIG